MGAGAPGAGRDSWSGGKLGYIHIQGMDEPSLEDFERDLFAAANGKQGLLIDVRNNGGGWTTDYLMTILTRPPPRLDGAPGRPTPRSRRTPTPSGCRCRRGPGRL